MQTLARYLQHWFEQLFNAALRGNPSALLTLRFSQIFSKVPIGLWYFRVGEVTKSQAALSKAKFKPQIAEQYIEQSEDILNLLSEPLLPSSTTNLQTEKFNGRVLFACHSNGKFHLNGYAIRTAEIARVLTTSNIEVIAVTRYGYPWDLRESQTNKVIEQSEFRGLIYHHNYDQNRLIGRSLSRYLKSYSNYLEGIAKKENVTVIHAHSNYINGLAAQRVCSANGWLSVYELRGLWHLTRASHENSYLNSEHFKFCERMEVKAALLCDKVVTLNEPLKHWLCENGIPEQKITIVPNGARRQKTRPRSSAIPNKLAIGYAGALTEYEGIDDTLKAIALLKANGQQVKFHIAGHGDYKKQLKVLSEKLDISDSVFFEGQITHENIRKFYEQINLVVLARKSTPVSRLVPPVKLVEAMSHGKAVIVSDLPPLAGIVKLDNCGIIVEPNDPHALSMAISSLMQSPELLERLSEKAFNVARSNYSWENLVQKYVDVYTGTDKLVSK